MAARKTTSATTAARRTAAARTRKSTAAVPAAGSVAKFADDLGAEEAPAPKKRGARKAATAPTHHHPKPEPAETVAAFALGIAAAAEAPKVEAPAEEKKPDIVASLIASLPKLTRQEADTLRGIAAAADGTPAERNPIWAWEVRTQIVRPAQVAGVVSSLSRKGLAEVYGEATARAIRLTESGAATYLAAVAAGTLPEPTESEKAIRGERPLTAPKSFTGGTGRPALPAPASAEVSAASAAASAKRGKETRLIGKTLRPVPSAIRRMNEKSLRTIVLRKIPAEGIAYETLMGMEGVRLNEVSYLVRAGFVSAE